MIDLLSRLLDKDEIVTGDALFKEIHEVKAQNEPLIAELNTGYKTADQVRERMKLITGQELDRSTSISLPFQTDFGRHIRLGRDVFINKEAFFVDLGGLFWKTGF